jgi:tetratricopeptide (TPR) repeat protein
MTTRSQTRNTVLAARMRALDMNARQLAEAMNKVLQTHTGRPAAITDRAIRRYLGGQTHWPQGRQRFALEAVCGCTAEELGFSPPPGYHAQEDDVHRRKFLAASAAATLAAPSPRRRIGRADVQALERDLNALIAQDNDQGGDTALETRALTQANVALDLIRHGSATESVRRSVYSVAAGATTSAAWAAIDSGRLDRAQQHLDRSLTLAGMAADPNAVARAWNNLSMLGFNRMDYAEAADAAEAGRKLPAARNDGLYASLAHARAALAQAARQDKAGALRSLGRAEQAMTRAADRDRPSWVYFYDAAELHGLGALALTHLGRPEEAERNAHYAIAHLKPDLVRNRAYYTAVLGLAQLRQGELELALSTIDPLFTDQLPGSARVRLLLRTFRREAAVAGSAAARGWLEQTRPLTT